MNEEHGARPGVRERASDGVGLRPLPPRVRERDDVAPEGARHRLPALAELALRDREHAVARRKEVHDRRLERAGTGRSEDEHVVRGAEDLAQPLERDLEHRGEVGRAVVEDRLGERAQHLRRHGRRAGRQELLRACHCPEPTEAPSVFTLVLGAVRVRGCTGAASAAPCSSGEAPAALPALRAWLKPGPTRVRLQPHPAVPGHGSRRINGTAGLAKRPGPTRVRLQPHPAVPGHGTRGTNGTAGLSTVSGAF